MYGGVFDRMKMALVVLVALLTVFTGSPLAASSNTDLPGRRYLYADAYADLAAKAFEAHGGEKLKGLDSLLVSGAVDVTVSSFQQAIPATFATAFLDEMYLLEVNSGIASFKQSFDGKTTYTAPDRGFSLPPLNRIGLALLQRMGQEGFVVSASEEKGGFRITSPEGFYTDFYPNKKTSLIKSYDAAYLVGGRTVTTKVEVKDYEQIEGVNIPSRYDQRFDLAGMTVYAAFKAKEIKVNTAIPQEVFGPVGK